MKTKTIIERSTHPNVTPKSLMTGRANGLLLLLLVMRFAMAPGWAQTYSVLHSFTGDDGSEPNGPLILSGDTLYGSTFLGGGPPGFVGGGTIFKINTNGSGFRVLYTFSNGDDGAQPNGDLVLSDNVLYGSTSSGPPLMPGFGTVFRINTDGTGFQVLKRFTADPFTGWPWTGPVVVSGTTLFGTFGSGPIPGAGGNAGDGTLFRMGIDGSDYVVLKYFSPEEGPPSGKLIMASDVLYGIASWGIYRINSDGRGYASLLHFPPYMAGTSLVPSGKMLCGTMNSGLTFGTAGSLFTLNIDGTAFKYLRYFEPHKEGFPDGLAVCNTTIFGINRIDMFGDQGIGLFQLNTDGTDYTLLASGATFSPSGLVYSGGTLYGVGRFSYYGSLLALPLPAPTIVTPPQTQTAEIGSEASIRVRAEGSPPLWYHWLFNGTNTVVASREPHLVLTNIQSSQAGTYTVVITNIVGSVTSAPTTLSLIPAVPREAVTAITLTGQPGSVLSLEYTAELATTQNWLPLANVLLTNSLQNYFDFSALLAPQRFYRAWESDAHNFIAELKIVVVPALTLSGTVEEPLRIDYINRFGPIDAWNTLATVTLSAPSQIHFDFSAIGRPARLYRIVHLP